MNKVILIGNIGKDAVLEGKKGSFSLATNETWTKDGEKQEKTTWHNVVIWNASENLIPHLTKGKKICVQGSIDNYQYEKDGETKYGSAVVADFRNGIEFIGNSSGGGAQGNSPPIAPPEDEDSIPF